MPMDGMDNDYIVDRLEKHKTLLEKLMSTEFELIDSCVTEIPDDGINYGAWYLGKSITLMSQADLVYFVDGWSESRGCRLEHLIAEDYGIKCVYEKSEIVKYRWGTVNKISDAIGVLCNVKDKLLLQDRQIEAAVVEKKIKELDESLRNVLHDLAKGVE